ncbi:GDP-mannose 4,6-dehydratase [Candidatus Berkelbacteria bacterium]|nr:GDP-mannose 4,6-dehydratase [Candidatus Berkelbacteria bacterium]
MRILVSGGAGFIGSHIVEAYRSLGHELAILDNFSTGLRENVHPDAKLYEVDLTDQSAVERAVREFEPELINHQAAHLSVPESVKKPQFNATVNILGFLNLMEAARRSVKRVIIASTGGALYGDTDQVPTPETHPTLPVSPYGVTKLTAEQYLHFYHTEYPEINWVALRYSNVYGPRQNPKGETGVIAVFLERMMTGQAATIYGDGLQTRDYVFVEDVARAHVAALDKGNGAYNIGTGQETNVKEIYAFLQKATDLIQEAQFGPARPGEQKRSALDCARAKTELDWEPMIELKEGVQRTVDWYKNRKS